MAQEVQNVAGNCVAYGGWGALMKLGGITYNIVPYDYHIVTT